MSNPEITTAHVTATETSVPESTESGQLQPDQADIAALAYALWEERGCPSGSPQEDWYHALEQLRGTGSKAAGA